VNTHWNGCSEVFLFKIQVSIVVISIEEEYKTFQRRSLSPSSGTDVMSDIVDEIYVIFDVPTPVTIKNTIFWDALSCSW
jgi:hypothetical protein